MTMQNDIAQVLFTETQIKNRVRELGAELARDRCFLWRARSCRKRSQTIS